MKNSYINYEVLTTVFIIIFLCLNLMSYLVPHRAPQTA